MRDYVRLCSPALEMPDREALSLSLGEIRKQLAQIAQECNIREATLPPSLAIQHFSQTPD
jgi:hypothetical protein